MWIYNIVFFGGYLIFSYSLIASFLDGNPQHRDITSIIWLVAATVFYTWFSHWQNSSLNVIVMFLLLFSLTLFEFKGRWQEKLLLSCAVTTLILLSEMVGMIPSALSMSKAGAFSPQIGNLSGIGRLIAIIVFIVMVFCVNALVRTKAWRLNTSVFPQNSMVFLFPLLSIGFMQYIMYCGVFAKDDRQYLTYSYIAIILLIAVNILLLYGGARVGKSRKLQRELSGLRYQEELMRQTVAQQDQYLRQLRQQAHDQKNHLLCINELMGIDNAVLPQNPDPAGAFPEVKNDALRALAAKTAFLCRESGIRFTTEIAYSAFDFLSYADIGALFGNAFDNAVEANSNGQPGRYITLTTRRVAGMVYIQVENSIFAPVHERDGRLETTKPNPEQHGIGFTNMVRIAEKHGGNIVHEHARDKFTLYISLPLDANGRDEA